MSSNVHQTISSLQTDLLSSLESRKGREAIQKGASVKDTLTSAPKEDCGQFAIELAVQRPTLPKGSEELCGKTFEDPKDLDLFKGIIEMLSAGVNSSIASQTDMIAMNRTMADASLASTRETLDQQRKLLEQEGGIQNRITQSTTGIMGKINTGYGWVMGISAALTFLPMVPGLGGLFSVACATWVGRALSAALSMVGTTAGATSTLLQYSLNKELSQQHMGLADTQNAIGRSMGDLSKLKNDFSYFQQIANWQAGVVERGAKQSGSVISVASDLNKGRRNCIQMLSQAV